MKKIQVKNKEKISIGEYKGIYGPYGVNHATFIFSRAFTKSIAHVGASGFGFAGALNIDASSLSTHYFPMTNR